VVSATANQTKVINPMVRTKDRNWVAWGAFGAAAAALAGLWTGVVLLSDSWLQLILAGALDKHSRHHANPNQLGKDPDIENPFVAFSSEATDRRRGLGAWLARRQGSFFIPLLMLEGVSLHASSISRALGRQPVKHRPVEIIFLAVRILGYLGLVFLLLSPGIAAAFVGVQVLVFGLLLGGAFAPNHIGMPITPRGMSSNFLQQQVLMSRDIRGGPIGRS
jgi:hypothetical protein